MCGIVAEHGGSDPQALERMLERLTHRGPDDRGSLGSFGENARVPASSGSFGEIADGPGRQVGSVSRPELLFAVTVAG